MYKWFPWKLPQSSFQSWNLLNYLFQFNHSTPLRISTDGYDETYQAFLNNFKNTISLIDKSMNNRSVTMTRKVEIARYSINLEKSFHSAPFFVIDIRNDPLKLLIIVHMIIYVLLVLREWIFFQVAHYIHQMHLKDIFNIKGEERARISWKLDIDFYL